MNNFNLAVIEGRLTKDAVLEHTPHGTEVLKFSIANNYMVKRKGNNVIKTSFFNVVAWGRLGIVVAEYLKKGKRIIVSGRLTVENYTTNLGIKKSYIQITANNIDFVSFGKNTAKSQ
jgi:single-strand DNA-binding protein